MSANPAHLEPAAPHPAPISEEELTLAVARWLSSRFARLGGRARAGAPEAAVFGDTVAALRSAAGLGRLELARRARLNPVYLALMEMGIWGPDELPAIAVAMFAVGLGRPLAELPTTPYVPGAEPVDRVDEDRDGVRLWLGLATLAPWVQAMIAGAAARPTTVWLPALSLPFEGGSLRVGGGQLGSGSAPALPSDEYRWRMVREAPPAARWWLHAQVDRGDGPAAGVELDLRMGRQRRRAVTDAMGELHFADLDPADIEPLRLAVAP